jgi:GTP pyrophosphokinase
MLTTERENPQTGGEPADIVAESRRFAAARRDRCSDPSLPEEGRAIAGMLERMSLSPQLLAAVHVYPLVRDGVIGIDELETSGLAELKPSVEGLVQLGRFSLPPDWQPGEALAVRQSEALRKMLLAVVADARLVVIRIAEQLYRLRRAKELPPEAQRALAVETREIYAPLANRLGVWQLKWQLEDLALRYLEPEAYHRIARTLSEKRAEREAAVEEACEAIAAELEAQGIGAVVSGRPKHIYSIFRKMQRKGRGIEQMFDVRAVRVLVDSVSDCYAALGAVHGRWSCLRGEFDDYIANPKENGYQSLHTAVVGPGGRIVEVQIRTHDMHRHAELGIAAHWRYKEGAGARTASDRKIQLLRELLEPAERDSDLLERIRSEVLEDRVYALSPKGDVVELPAGSTPLDFAYHVHTLVGHRCRGAKVNGRIVPLTYRVQNGDRIEIITAKEPQPSRDWLSPQHGYLASTRSRTKVRAWFRQQDKDQNRKHGREILEKELARLNAGDTPTDDIAKQLKLADTNALHVALGAGDVTPAAVASALQQLHKAEIPAERKARNLAARRRTGRQIEIRGLGNLLRTLARCCRPIPPEAIAGYITQGRGVSIHRQDCGNFLNLHARHPERVIDVSWGEPTDESYPAELELEAYNRQDLLRDVSGILADEHAGIESVNTNTTRDGTEVRMELRVLVPGLAGLSRVMSKLERLPNVTSVRRKG